MLARLCAHWSSRLSCSCWSPESQCFALDLRHIRIHIIFVGRVVLPWILIFVALEGTIQGCIGTGVIGFVVISVLVWHISKTYLLCVAIQAQLLRHLRSSDLPLLISNLVWMLSLISVCCRCWCPVGVTSSLSVISCLDFVIVVRHEFSFGQFAFYKRPCLVLDCWHNCCRIGRNEFAATFAPILKHANSFSTGIFIWRCCCSSSLHPPSLQNHFLLNSGLVVLVACLCTDAFVWLLAYEISLISTCTAFSLEGRACRRTLLSESCWYCR